MSWNPGVSCFSPGVLEGLSLQNRGESSALFLWKVSPSGYTCNQVFRRGGSYAKKLLFCSLKLCPDVGRWHESWPWKYRETGTGELKPQRHLHYTVQTPMRREGGTSRQKGISSTLFITWASLYCIRVLTSQLSGPGERVTKKEDPFLKTVIKKRQGTRMHGRNSTCKAVSPPSDCQPPPQWQPMVQRSTQAQWSSVAPSHAP